MKLNINDTAKLQDLKQLLAEKNVAATAIVTLEKALKKGMIFKSPDDLAILNMPALDLNVVGTLVTFGPKTVVVKNIKTVEYRFRPVGDEAFFFGYQFVITFEDKDGFTIEQSYPIEDEHIVVVDYDLNELPQNGVVFMRVNSAQGQRAGIRASASAEFKSEIDVPVPKLANQSIDVEVEKLEHAPNPDVTETYPIKGKVISNRSDAKLDGYQIVIFAATEDLSASTTPDFAPVAFAKTESNGYFVTSPLLFDDNAKIDRVTAGKAAVTKDDFRAEFAIRLVVSGGDDDATPRTSRLPDRLILVINEGEAADAENAADGECGCTDLNFSEKKVLEEYSYYTVVRTSEPSIIADVLDDEPDVDLQDIYGVPGVVPFSVFQKYHAIQSRQIKGTAFQPSLLASGPSSATTAIAARAPNVSAVFNQDLLDRLVVEHKAQIVIKGNAKPVFKGRTHLNQTNQIDWDDEPTIYQAASISHGHLLHFKQEWMPDGYSIGDIVYSLPLAPGQKKQIAVLDWERRESAANSQSLEYEESLNNSLIRDRDINEIVSGTLTENIRGSSKATTSGIGFGLGGAIMGAFSGGTFGALLGISGGKSSSGASAGQTSNRESTVNSLQSISDRTHQAASVVRAQRATVVQTVSQGERVQATAESVANYNHCHAITIQYFEVLRHFSVRNRLAGVQECLFIPLQMSPFDLQKCLRWRNSLEKHLLRRELLGAFDAVARVQNEKESPFENYYDSIGFPRRNFAEQAINNYSGELFMEFFFFNTKEKKIDDEIIAFFTFFGISLDQFRDRAITDEELAEHVGPRAIEYLLDAFTIETDKGVDLKLDLTLLSTFRQNSTLRVSMRQSAGTSTSIARDQIAAVNIKLDLSKLSAQAADNLRQFQNKYMKIRLRSGNLRYRTDNLSGVLFSGGIDNDIFADGDGAYVVTPLTRDELRNPRGEDVSAVNNLIHHLNENLEHYHKCLFFDMTPERRFMLLDGIIAPGKALGRSVASVVENRVIGIAGNSLIMPVAPGYQLDPTIDETFDLFAQYYHEDPEPMRISIPTKGIYAEAVMGKCNSCEEKEESRFWRWEESPIPDSPNTQILPLNTDTRRADPGDLQPRDFPNPVVNIQNAPSLPDPSGLQNLLQLLGKGDSFRDITGLNQTQLNALAAFQKTLDTAQSFGKEASELAKSAAQMKLVEDAKKSGAVSNEKAKEKAGAVLDNATQDPNVTRLKQGVDALDQLEKSGALTSADAAAAKQGLLKTFLDNSSAKSSLSNQDVESLSATANKNNTDISVKRSGEEVDIKKAGESGIAGNTTTQVLRLQHLANHEGYEGKFRLRANLEADGAFTMELINDSFDYVDAGPTQPRNAANITLSPTSLPFGTLVPINPRSTSMLYEGTLSGNPADVFPDGTFSISTGLKLAASVTKSSLKYKLPFKAGLRIPCTEGRNTGTHTGASRFGIDFAVPRGTQVLAAMDGTVVDFVKVHPNMPIGTRGSTDVDNIVRVRHVDGTYATYGHLNPNSVQVTAGQKIQIGTILALSGNSGDTNGDHLHFVVEKVTDTSRESLEFDFYDGSAQAFVPVTGGIYESAGGKVSGKLIVGTGDPENNVVGDVGDYFARTDGGPGTLYYLKETGAGTNTGWKAKAALP
jgi:murein DD-endopeptidase MepM/ murein hydrolase activator NlpD